MQSYSSIDITFTNETTRSTFRSVIHEIRRVFDVRVTAFNNSDEFAEFYVRFESSINPDRATMQYSRRLSKKARKYIASMEIHAITSPATRTAAERMSHISIDATNGTTRSTFADVMREVTKKLSVRVMYSEFDDFLGHIAMFEGPISTDDVFMQYSRKLSKKALGSIKLSAEDIGRPTTPTNVAPWFSTEPSDFGFGPKILEFFREIFEQDSLRDFRLDAPPMPDGYLLGFVSSHPEERPLRLQWPSYSMQRLLDEPTDDKQ